MGKEIALRNPPSTGASPNGSPVSRRRNSPAMSTVIIQGWRSSSAPFIGQAWRRVGGGAPSSSSPPPLPLCSDPTYSPPPSPSPTLPPSSLPLLACSHSAWRTLTEQRFPLRGQTGFSGHGFPRAYPRSRGARPASPETVVGLPGGPRVCMYARPLHVNGGGERGWGGGWGEK